MVKRVHLRGLACHPRASGPRTWDYEAVTCFRCKKKLRGARTT